MVHEDTLQVCLTNIAATNREEKGICFKGLKWSDSRTCTLNWTTGIGHKLAVLCINNKEMNKLHKTYKSSLDYLYIYAYGAQFPSLPVTEVGKSQSSLIG